MFASGGLFAQNSRLDNRHVGIPSQKAKKAVAETLAHVDMQPSGFWPPIKRLARKFPTGAIGGGRANRLSGPNWSLRLVARNKSCHFVLFVPYCNQGPVQRRSRL
jgi:hypothetical protein